MFVESVQSFQMTGLAVPMLIAALQRTYHLSRDVEAAEAVLQNDPRLVHRTLVARRPHDCTCVWIMIEPQLRAKEGEAIHPLATRLRSSVVVAGLRSPRQHTPLLLCVGSGEPIYLRQTQQEQVYYFETFHGRHDNNGLCGLC